MSAIPRPRRLPGAPGCCPAKPAPPPPPVPLPSPRAAFSVVVGDRVAESEHGLVVLERRATSASVLQLSGFRRAACSYSCRGGDRPASGGRCGKDVGVTRPEARQALGPETCVGRPGGSSGADATGSTARGAGAAGGLSRSTRRGGGGGGSGGWLPLRHEICGQSKRICGWCASISRMASASIAARPTRTPGGVRNQ